MRTARTPSLCSQPPSSMPNCVPGHKPLQEALAAILHCCLALRAVLLPDDVLGVLYQTEVNCREVLLCKGGIISLVAALAACRVSKLFRKARCRAGGHVM